MTWFVSALLAAVLLDTPLTDADQEARALALMREIRCVACENEPVSQSAAPIAEDMRARIRELVADGKTDAEIRHTGQRTNREFQ
ncbi:MAG: cytochrome c-type biogenesis protein CcmH, partial [Pseudomonadota bacterium]